MPVFNMIEGVKQATEIVKGILGHLPCDKKKMLEKHGDKFCPEFLEIIVEFYPDDRIHKAPPGADRANFRSATPRGFARAVFEANAK